MDNLLLKQLLKEYDQKRQSAILDSEKRKQKLFSSNTRLAEIEKKLNLISLSTVKSMLTTDKSKKDELLEDLKKQTEALNKEKESILKKINFNVDEFSPKFECTTCEDTGYTNFQGNLVLCNCIKQKLFNIVYNKSNIGNLEKENFNTFNERLYSDKPNKELYNTDISPRENILKIKEKALTFIENFDDPDEKNLIFTGGTGLGKTFLSNCIANEVLKQGKTVLYQTAPVMLDSIIDEKFNKSTSNQILDNILNVDLLIIDDLGTENINSLKLTELFTIINTRLLNQNHKITKTIISTNLDVNNIFSIYNDRIGSRLAGFYKFLRFYGDDIRFTKK